MAAGSRAGGAEYPVGILVTDISIDSAYEAAGGQVNDVIVELAGKEMSTIDDLLSTLRRHRAGDAIEIRILRGDDEQILDVELGRLE